MAAGPVTLAHRAFSNLTMPEREFIFRLTVAKPETGQGLRAASRSISGSTPFSMPHGRLGQSKISS
jgi:hypothetical protein